jgi:hypothetical protein
LSKRSSIELDEARRNREDDDRDDADRKSATGFSIFTALQIS